MSRGEPFRIGTIQREGSRLQAGSIGGEPVVITLQVASGADCPRRALAYLGDGISGRGRHGRHMRNDGGLGVTDDGGHPGHGGAGGIIGFSHIKAAGHSGIRVFAKKYQGFCHGKSVRLIYVSDGTGKSLGEKWIYRCLESCRSGSKGLSGIGIKL